MEIEQCGEGEEDEVGRRIDEMLTLARDCGIYERSERATPSTRNKRRVVWYGRGFMYNSKGSIRNREPSAGRIFEYI